MIYLYFYVDFILHAAKKASTTGELTPPKVTHLNVWILYSIESYSHEICSQKPNRGPQISQRSKYLAGQTPPHCRSLPPPTAPFASSAGTLRNN